MKKTFLLFTIVLISVSAISQGRKYNKSILKSIEMVWLNLARITLAPESRGPVYFEDVTYALEKAKELNPDNPRTYYLQAILTLNLPDFMGGGPQAAKPIFLEADKKFKAFQNDDPLWPGWGEEHNQEELERL